MSGKKRLYNTLFTQQDEKCAICSKPLGERFRTHIDRIVPGREGGKYVLENCQLIHDECDWEKEGNAPRSVYPQLAAAYRSFKLWQTEAGRMDRKIRAYDGDLQNTSKSPYRDAHTFEELLELRTYLQEQEKIALKRLKQFVRELPEWKGFMKAAPALKERTAGMLLSRVNIEIADTVSSLWKFLGYFPQKKEDGGGGYNPGLGKDFKAPLYAALSISLIRKNSPYRAVYDKHKARDLRHGQALYRTIKLWLAHLWETWRRFKDLPVTEPYATNHLGHTGFQAAKDFGWPEV